MFFLKAGDVFGCLLNWVKECAFDGLNLYLVANYFLRSYCSSVSFGSCIFFAKIIQE